MKIALIGAGRVGTAVITRLKRKYKITGIWDIDKRAEKRCYRVLKRKHRIFSLEELVKEAEVILIATPDREIERVYQEIKSFLKKDKTLIHFSGALSSNIFKKRGIGRASMHPVQTFPSMKSSIKPGLYFVIEGNPKGMKIAKELIKAMKGKYIILSPKSKPLYHTMCVASSNFLVGLLDFAVELGKALKLRPEKTIEILSPIIDQTLRNIKELGPIQALSGPVERGEFATIEKHLQSLKRLDPRFLDLYISFSSYLLSIAKKKGSISELEEKEFLKKIEGSRFKT